MPENHTEPQESSHKASSNFWKKCFKFALIMAIPLGFLVWICLFRDTPLEISKETTYVTEPLTADGKWVDYLRALELEMYPPNMKTDENGYRLLVRALGPIVDRSSPNAAKHAKQVYEKLGLDPSIPPTMTHLDISSFLYPKENGEELYDKTQQLWTLEELPMMDEWLEQNGPALDAIAQAVRKSEFCRPQIRDDACQDATSWLTPYMQEVRSFHRSLTARAYYRIGTGNIDGAIDDIITLKALARHSSRQGLFISVQSSVAHEGFANQIGIASSPDHQPTEAQLQYFIDQLRTLPRRVTFKEVVLFERYYMLDMIQQMIQERAPKNGWSFKSTDKLGRMIDFFGYNWSVVMSEINSHFNALEKLDPLPSLKSLNWFTFSTSLSSTRSKILANFLAHLTLPLYYIASEQLNEVECADRIQIITLAMLIYEKQHEHLPPVYTVDKDGKPLHSWRVLLLPNLGEEAKKLYAQIKLGEPWDSEHNRQFHNKTVSFYQCPSAKLKSGQTTYSVALGEKTAFGGSQGKKLDQFGPDSNSLILVFDTDKPACWMDPTSDLTEEESLESFKRPPHDNTTPTGLRSGEIKQLQHFDVHPGISNPPEDIINLQSLRGTVKKLIGFERTYY